VLPDAAAHDGPPCGEDRGHGWHREQHTRLPAYDNAALRQRLADIPLRTTSIEAELRALMAERRAAQAEAKPKRSSRWS